MATLVDTNILVDVAVRDPDWLAWSRRQLELAKRGGAILINQIIYAEFAVRYRTPDQVEQVIPADEFRREGLPWAATFAASRAFAAYRRAGGPRDKVLPDFFIGAHAMVRDYAVLTRDPTGFRRYFPMVNLICPDTHP